MFVLIFTGTGGTGSSSESFPKSRTTELFGHSKYWNW